MQVLSRYPIADTHQLKAWLMDRFQLGIGVDYYTDVVAGYAELILRIPGVLVSQHITRDELVTVADQIRLRLEMVNYAISTVEVKITKDTTLFVFRIPLPYKAEY